MPVGSTDGKCTVLLVGNRDGRTDESTDESDDGKEDTLPVCCKDGKYDILMMKDGKDSSLYDGYEVG